MTSLEVLKEKETHLSAEFDNDPLKYRTAAAVLFLVFLSFSVRKAEIIQRTLFRRVSTFYEDLKYISAE